MHTIYLLRRFRLPRLPRPGRLRLLFSLFAALVLLPSVLGVTTPAQAQQLPSRLRDPDRRIQIFVKTITIIADKEWGEGEFSFSLLARRMPPGCEPPDLSEKCYVPEFMVHYFSSHGHDLDDLAVNQVIPGAETKLTPGDRYIHELAGFPVYSDETYSVRIHSHEIDTISAEYMGTVSLKLTPENYWERGTKRVRASKDEGKTNEGDFEVELEIRDMPLPDLRPTSLKVLNAPGSTEKLVCTGLVNSGAVDSPRFVTGFYVNGSWVAGEQAGHLPPGQYAEMCAQIALPATGKVTLAAWADSARGIDEVSDTNNRIEIQYSATGAGATDDQPTPMPRPPATPGTPPTSGSGKADLVGAAFLVNGRTPDGKDDCKDGKNTITVRFKNAGTADTGSFVVQMKIGGFPDGEPKQTVKGLPAGKEQEVRFENVRLKKGEHLMYATLDAANSVTESDETNNELVATPTCKDDD